MKSIGILLAIGAAVCGIVAARYWYQSSIVVIAPMWTVEPGDADVARDGWIAGTMEAVSRSAELNKVASIWTAVSVLLAAASAVIGSLI